MCIIIVTLSVTRIVGRIESNFYDAALMRGATKWTYWGSMYINDVMINLIVAPVIYLTLMIFDITAPGSWFVWMQYSFTDPLFIYTWIYLFCIVKGTGGWVVSLISILSIVLALTFTGTATGFISNNDPKFQLMSTIFYTVAGFFSPAGNYLAS